jgi:hypothetical protein
MHEIVHKIWILMSIFCHIISNSKKWARGGYLQLFPNNRVISKVGLLGGTNGQFWHNRASNAELGMKILQKEINGTPTSFPTNFGGKLSFIPSFFLPFHCPYLYNYYN